MKFSPSYQEYRMLMDYLSEYHPSRKLPEHSETENEGPSLPYEEIASSLILEEFCSSGIFPTLKAEFLGEGAFAMAMKRKWAATSLLYKKEDKEGDPDVLFIHSGSLYDDLLTAEEETSAHPAADIYLFTSFPGIREAYDSLNLPGKIRFAPLTETESPLLQERLSYIETFLALRNEPLTHFRFPEVVETVSREHPCLDRNFLPSLLYFPIREDVERNFRGTSFTDLTEILFSDYAPFDLRYRFLLDSYGIKSPLTDYASRVFLMEKSLASPSVCQSPSSFDTMIANIRAGNDMKETYRTDPVLGYFLVVLSLIRFLKDRGNK